MRVLLVSPNREQLPDPVFPLGLAYIASSLKKHGHQVRSLDLCFSEDIDSVIPKSVEEFQPEVIGMSLRNIDDVAYPKKHSYLQEYKEAVQALRKHTRAPLVLGGSGFTIMPEAFMSELGAEYGIVGEGEKSFPELLKRVGAGRSWTGSRVLWSRTRLKDLDQIAPDRGLFDCATYYRLGGMLSIQTKRGCPFNCIYCTYPKVEGKRVRLRGPSLVADEISRLVETTGIRHLFIVDSVFNYPVSHAMDVCDEIIRRKIDISWSCYANPSHMTERLAGTMAEAGCTGVEFGTDSLVDETLSTMGKSFTYHKVKQASAACKKAGLKFCHFIFAGSPGDTDETVRMNLERLEDIDPDAAVIMAGIRVFPGTRLAEMARQDLGIADFGLEPVFYLSRGIEDYDAVAEQVASRRHWVMPGYEINLHPRLQRKLREHGFKGPLWEELAKR